MPASRDPEEVGRRIGEVLRCAGEEIRAGQLVEIDDQGVIRPVGLSRCRSTILEVPASYEWGPPADTDLPSTVTLGGQDVGHLSGGIEINLDVAATTASDASVQGEISAETIRAAWEEVSRARRFEVDFDTDGLAGAFLEMQDGVVSSVHISRLPVTSQRLAPSLRDYLDDVWDAIQFRIQVWCRGGEWNWTEEELGLTCLPEGVHDQIGFTNRLPVSNAAGKPMILSAHGKREDRQPSESVRFYNPEELSNSLTDWPYSEDNPVPTLEAWKAGVR